MIKGWNNVKLDNVCSLVMGQSPDGNTINQDKLGIPFLQGNAEFNRVYPIEKNWTINPKKISKRDSILFSVRAPVGEINISNKEFAIGRGLCSISFKEDNNQLLLQILEYNKRNFQVLSQGSTFEAISKSELENFNFLIPSSKKEQKKIAKILILVDNAIESSDKIISKQKRIKMGLMQDLLTCGIDKNGNIRNESTHKFKDSPLGRIPVEWMDLVIGNICKVRDGTHQTPKYTTEGMPFYSVETITKNDFVNVKYISVAEHKQLTKNYKIETNDVLMTRIGSIGDCKYIDWIVDASFYVSLALLKFDNPILAQYFTQYSNHQIFKTEISLHSLPFAIPKKINLGNISDVRIILPSDEGEQKRIFSILSKQDETIEQEERKLKKLQSIKKALMQDLLTGKVRVNYE